VLEKGECDVYAMKAGVSQHVAVYAEGEAFGELALIYDSTRTSTVRAKTDVILWAIDRVTFRSIVTVFHFRFVFVSFVETLVFIISDS
jgi:cAMP-dependent protein kinase regulator